MMTPHAQRFIKQFCELTEGIEAAGRLDTLEIGREVGLTGEQTVAAIQELAAHEYLAHGYYSGGIWLTDTGAALCRRVIPPLSRV
jgi:hypothetical protein